MSEMRAPDAIAQQAIEWLVHLHSGEMTQEERLVFERWRDANPAHDLACRKIEHSLGSMPRLASQPALRETLRKGGSRREFLRTALTIAAVASAGGWIYDRQSPVAGLFADMHTRTSERRTTRLSDGTLLTMNARTRLDLDFGSGRRNIRLLSGQIYIEASQSPLPLLISTSEGQLKADAGIFTASSRDGTTRIAALSQPALVTAGVAAAFTLPAQSGVDIRDQRITPRTISASAESAWINGFVEINDQPLGSLIEALRDYRAGVIRLSPEAAKLRVSGIFPLDNTDFALEAVAQTLPVVVSRTTGYWVSISAS